MRDTIASLRLPSCVPRPCARKDARNIACRACSPCRNVSIEMFFVVIRESMMTSKPLHPFSYLTFTLDASRQRSTPSCIYISFLTEAINSLCSEQIEKGCIGPKYESLFANVPVGAHPLLMRTIAGLDENDCRDT